MYKLTKFPKSILKPPGIIVDVLKQNPPSGTGIQPNIVIED